MSKHSAGRRVVFARNGIHFLGEGGRAELVLSPEQLQLLAALRRGYVPDPGAVLGYPPDRRLRPGAEGGGRTPAQRAALSRALRRLAEHGLTSRRLGGKWLRLTPLGEEYADLILPMVCRSAERGAPERWVERVAQVAGNLGSSEAG